MFQVDGNKITMHRGDTGTLAIRLSGREFISTDRILFTIARAGAVKMQRVYPIVNNTVVVEFANGDTDTWQAGTNYSWEVRFVHEPEYDDGTGLPVDGSIVRTPVGRFDMEVLNVIGNI